MEILYWQKFKLMDLMEEISQRNIHTEIRINKTYVSYDIFWKNENKELQHIDSKYFTDVNKCIESLEKHKNELPEDGLY